MMTKIYLLVNRPWWSSGVSHLVVKAGVVGSIPTRAGALSMIFDVEVGRACFGVDTDYKPPTLTLSLMPSSQSKDIAFFLHQLHKAGTSNVRIRWILIQQLSQIKF